MTLDVSVTSHIPEWASVKSPVEILDSRSNRDHDKGELCILK